MQGQHQRGSIPQTQSQQTASDAVDRLLRQAEISRLTRNLKSKLALASMKTHKSPSSTPKSEPRRRAKTLEGALPSPRPNETPTHRPRSNSRRSSVTSVSSVSSLGSSSSMASPRARIPRISSVSSIHEGNYEDDTEPSSATAFPRSQFQPHRVTPQTSPLQHHEHQHQDTKPQLLVEAEEEPLPQEPQTPPSSKRSYPKTPERSSSSDGANLLLHFAHSPGRATPRTPDFNMSDYLHFQTPSPARGQLTPRHVRWGSLNSALFQPAGPVMMPKPAGTGFGDDHTS